MRKKSVKKVESKSMFQKDTTVPGATASKLKFASVPEPIPPLYHNLTYARTQKEFIKSLKLQGHGGEISEATVATFVDSFSNMLDNNDSFSRPDLQLYIAAKDIPADTVNKLYEAFVECLVAQGKVCKVDGCYSESVYVQTPYQIQV